MCFRIIGDCLKPALILCAALAATSTAFADTASLTSATLPSDSIWLESLNLSGIDQEWQTAQAGKSVEGRPITLAGVVYPHGVGSHARSTMEISLNGSALKFESMVGVDDEVAGKGSVIFQVWVDGKKLADSGVLRGGNAPKAISVDLTGAKHMQLIIDTAGDGNSYDHADWAGAQFTLVSADAAKPTVLEIDKTPMPIATGVSPKPRINGARVVGTTPGMQFMFGIAATGEGPLKFSASGLPAGLKLDAKTGVITGSIAKAGKYKVRLKVTGTQGTAQRDLTIISGKHKLMQTPPMGWNSWNVWGGNLDESKVRAAADWMVKSGLAARGYQYINIDDCWQGKRDANGVIHSNDRFPDMKALADYVHSKGLKIGIYSSPGPTTCAGYEGSYNHEEQDAKTWAEWGMDYVKYDWCSYGQIAKNSSLEELQKPYILMRKALDNCGRDIAYSLCQYGMGDVWKWGAEVGGNCWRTTGDITDTWSSMSGIGFSQSNASPYAGPGHWNDPDMLVVGRVGWGSPHPTKLTPNEQITHITLWSLLSAPLLIGCDMSQIDQFTLDVLGNDEVIDVNQDPLGKAAVRKIQDNGIEVWTRPLSDGTLAVGLFNRSGLETVVKTKWSDLDITGSQPVRDLWLKKDVGTFNGSYAVPIKPHGAVLLKIGKPAK